MKNINEIWPIGPPDILLTIQINLQYAVLYNLDVQYIIYSFKACSKK